MNLTRIWSIGSLMLISAALVLIFSLQQKSFLLLLIGLQLAALSAGIIYKRLLSASIVTFSILIALVAAELYLKLHEQRKPAATSQVLYTDNDYSKKYFVRGDIGYVAKPGVHSSVKATTSGEVIYKAQYTIGEDGFRITPSNNNSSNARINFFGCSFTFGEGLNDNQTLPFFVAQQSQFYVKNFGFHGYGPQQALGILTSNRDTKGKINFFLTTPWHAERSACVPSYTLGSNRYVLDNGVVRQQGFCGDSQNSEQEQRTERTLIERVLWKSRIYNLAKDFVEKISTQNRQLELFVAILEKMNSLSKERGQDFVVGYIKANDKWFVGFTYSNESIVQRLKSKGIHVIDLTLSDSDEELERKYYIHDLDKHPSGKANEERARILLQAIQ